MKQIPILMIFLFFVAGCQNERKGDFLLMNQPLENPKNLRKAVIEDGDTSAYNELSIQYLSYGYGRFLPFALIMANKYNYPEAYFDIFASLSDLNRYYQNDNDNDWSLDSLDNNLREMAVTYLIKAANKGNEQAQEVLGNYYLEGKYVKKNIALGNRLIQEAKQ